MCICVYMYVGYLYAPLEITGQVGWALYTNNLLSACICACVFLFMSMEM